jgi:hypothetical protein
LDSPAELGNLILDVDIKLKTKITFHLIINYEIVDFHREIAEISILLWKHAASGV